MEPEAAPDLRVPLLAAVAWAGALLGRSGGPGWVCLAAGAILVVAAHAWRAGDRERVRTTLALALVLVGVGLGAAVRVASLQTGAVSAWAQERAVVHARLVVTSDPRPSPGRFGGGVTFRARVTEVTGRGQSYAGSVPVFVVAGQQWAGVPLGARATATARLSVSDHVDDAAVLSLAGPPSDTTAPSPWWRAASEVRESLRRVMSGRPEDQRALVPALVDGDDGALDPGLAADFQATGLTHLLAVSGTNLTLVVGFLLLVSRWVGVRGRWLGVVGAVGVAAFVLLARAEPSVLRAAAMGTVALVGLRGRARGLRALSVAVVVLLLLDPALAASWGFALSTLATAGILVLAPAWRDALGTWLPRWLAEAVAVPAAAQLACTPLVAAISGQVSLVAVVANLLAAPLVAPATVLGLLGGLLGLVSPVLGKPCGLVAGWCVGGIVEVARRGAALPTATLAWGNGPVALVVLTLLTLAVALLGARLLRRRGLGLAGCLVLVLPLVVHLPSPGWPPHGWVMVACDVGQGDGLVLNAGGGAAVVVDAGPDAGLMDACLDSLHVHSVPLLVLTHFHADHVDGISGVGRGRPVGRVWVSRLADPPGGVSLVRGISASWGVRPEEAPYAVPVRVGDVRLRVLWPLPDSATVGPGDGSTANNASVVMLAQVRGVRLFLGGDVEPEGQAAIARAWPGLQVDVLKVPHHGSRYQDPDFLRSLGARLGVISVGVDNDYGHPASSTISALASTGMTVLRTDLDGAVAVVASGDALAARTQGSGPP